MVLNTLQNLGLWAKSKKKIFFDLPLDLRQMLGFALNIQLHVLIDTEQEQLALLRRLFLRFACD